MNYETSYPLLDGGLNWYDVQYRAVKSSNGDITGICIAVSNITERKRVEDELALSGAKLSEAQTIASIGSWDIDMATNLHTWSDELYRIFGIEKTVASQDLFASFVHEGDTEMVAHSMQQAFATTANGSFNFRFVRKDKAQRFGYAEWRFEFDKTGRPLRLYGIVQDVTDKKEAELQIRGLNENLEARITERTSELTQANDALEAFSYSVSHDLRSPVRSVMGFAKIIDEQYGAEMDADLKEMFGYIESSSHRMNLIIDSLLELAKTGKEKLRPVAVDLTSLFKQIWGDIILATPYKAQFILPQMPTVYADSTMLQQVIVNLLSNAAKYSAKKSMPQVVVGYESTADTVTISVTDNGAGFDMKFYDRLFGAFQRLHSMSEFEGTGVGLMLVKRIIERHGGTVWASGEVGRGATFYFTLPQVIKASI